MTDYIIAPSILSADMARLGDDTAKVLAAGATLPDRAYDSHSGQGFMPKTRARNSGQELRPGIH